MSLEWGRGAEGEFFLFGWLVGLLLVCSRSWYLSIRSCRRGGSFTLNMKGKVSVVVREGWSLQGVSQGGFFLSRVINLQSSCVQNA